MQPNVYTNRTKNIWKTWALMSGFLVFVIAIGFIFSEIYGSFLILYIAITFSLIMNIIAYWQSDKIALASSRAKQIQKEDNPELWNVVENLSITAGLPMPRLYIINDDAPNAFATGRNKEHAAVAVTSGLLAILDRSELEGVIAHELSHIGNKDILIGTVAVVLAGFIALLGDIFLRATLFGGGRRSSGEGGGFLIIIGLVLAILSPIAATLIQLAISRKREFLADSSGVLLTRYPEGLANALRKISTYSQPLKHASNATAHLFIANPFGSKKSKGGFRRLFMTHPPIQSRIDALLGVQPEVEEKHEG